MSVAPQLPGPAATPPTAPAAVTGLVLPPAHRRALTWAGPVPRHPSAGSPDPLWWWLGAHGGAGVSTLTALLRCSADARRAWPSGTPGECPNVVVVARTHTEGLAHARDLATQHAGGALNPGLRLLGLVTVADAPGRLPTPLRRTRDLVSAAYPRAWHLPWVDDWRTTALDQMPGFDPERDQPPPASRGQLGAPREVAECGRALTTLALSDTAHVSDTPHTAHTEETR